MFRIALVPFVAILLTLDVTPTHAQLSLCAAGKDKCVSQEAAAILKCYGKNDKTGLQPADLATCIQKAKAKFDGGADPTKSCFAKLEAKYPGECLTTSDTTSLESTVDTFVADAYCKLHPTDQSATCSKLVFITSTTYATGNLNGLAAADAACQTQASAAGLPGVYKAWLSTTTTSAASRLTHSTHPYRLVDGTQVASDWTDLTDGTIAAPIDKTELGATVAMEFVWTDTNTDGSAAAYDCLGWMSSSASNLAGAGDSTNTNQMWTNRGVYYCDGSLFGSTPRALYCFQQ